MNQVTIDEARIKALMLIDEMVREGYDFTWTRNADLIDDARSYVRFHRMGQYGVAEGSQDISELVFMAYKRLKEL